MRRHLPGLFVGFVCGLYAAAPGLSASTSVLEDATVSRAETEALVRQDLARRLKVDAGQLSVVSADDRTWSDPSFGCSARKGLTEPVAIPGFAITLGHDGRQFVYHTDREGHFRRCDRGKPIAPISR